jgi:WD40 repeat protein
VLPANGGFMTQNPYVGPRPIADHEHAGEKIWGRDREIAELADVLIANRIVLLYSPSGAGKTSLLRAGVIPSLEQKRFPARPMVRVGAPVPDRLKPLQPVNRYTLSVLLSLEETRDEKTPDEELARLTLAEYLGREERPRELLIFDQFEEVLTTDPLDSEGKEAFFVQLGEALAVRSRWAILSMREDLVGPLDRYRKHLPTRLSHTYRLGLLTKTAAIDAVVGPAATCGVTVAKDAAEKLVENLSAVTVDDDDSRTAGATKTAFGEYVEPVQLQVVCRRLWSTWQDAATVGPDDVGDLASVDDALAAYYAQTVRETAAESKVEEHAIRAWVGRALITSREPPTRRQSARSDKETAPVLKAVKWLRRHYLIRSELRLGQVWYELSHDRLIRPILLDNVANTPEFQRKAAEWVRSGHKTGLLLDSRDLKRLKNEANGAVDDEKAFWDQSVQKHRSKVVIRGLETAAAVGLVAVAGLAYEIYRDNQRLEQRERELASVSLARQAEGRSDERLDLAMLLAVQAWKEADTPEAFAALYSLVNTRPQLVRVLSHDSLVLDSAFLPNGGVAVALDGGGLALWSPDGKLVASAPPQKVSWVKLAVSRDGRLAAASADGRICLLDTHTGVPIAEAPERHESAVILLQFDPTGRLLASADFGREFRFWMAGDKELALPAPGDGLPARLPFDEVSQPRLLAGSLARPLLDKILADDAWQQRLPSSVDPLHGAISPDGKRAAVSDGRKIRILDESGRPLAELTGFHNDVEGLTFSGDGNSLAAHPHFSRSVWIWDVRPPVPAEFSPIELYSNKVGLVSTSDAKGRQLDLSRDKATGKVILSYLNEARVASLAELSGAYSPYVELRLGEHGGRPLAIFGEESGTIHIRWADDPARELSSIEGESAMPNRDGTLLAVTGPGQSSVRLYSLKDLSHPVLLPANLTPGGEPYDRYGEVAAFSFARDVLAIGGPRIGGNESERGAVVNLWDLTDPNHPLFLCMLALNAKETKSLRFSPDGDTLASIDTTVKLWSVPATPLTGSRMLYPRATLGAHEGVPGNIRFSPNSALLAFGEHSGDGWGSHIHLADAQTGGLLGEPVDVGRPSQVMAFRENKLELWSYHSNSSDELEGILGVPFEAKGWVDTLCRKANRNLSLEEWTMFVGDAPYEVTCPLAPPRAPVRKKRWWQFR